jgi:translation elongation factor EF-Tu-like GTPase
MTMPPLFPEAQLWMTVENVFHIKGRGTVVTGQLQGNGQLSVGDALVWNDRGWQVGGIEQLRVALTTAAPGSHIGVLLENGPPADVLRGRIVHFVSSPMTMPGGTFPGVAPRKKRWRG